MIARTARGIATSGWTYAAADVLCILMAFGLANIIDQRHQGADCGDVIQTPGWVVGSVWAVLALAVVSTVLGIVARVRKVIEGERSLIEAILAAIFLTALGLVATGAMILVLREAAPFHAFCAG